MSQRHTAAQVMPYPRYQRFAAEAYRSVRHTPVIHGLFAVDVTEARAVLSRHKAQTGETLSFTAFLIACLAKAVDEHKAVQAFRQGRKRLVLFEDVDVTTRVERSVAGQTIVVPYIIRAANRKTVRELHDEIRAAQRNDVSRVLTASWVVSYLPPVLFRPFIWAYKRLGRWSPRLLKQTMGTVGITSVGMFVKGAGWGIPIPAPTALMLTVGGIEEQQVIKDGQPAVRERLSLTVSVNHDVVDGGPAARFTRRLTELIESAYGLDGISDGDRIDTAGLATAGAPPQPDRQRTP